MILKFRTQARAEAHSGEWLIFDNVNELLYDVDWFETERGVSLGDQVGMRKGWDAIGANWHIFDGPYQENDEKRFGRLFFWYDQDGDPHILYTDSQDVYVMSDQGDTIERL